MASTEKAKQGISSTHARMWPREILYLREGTKGAKKRRPADLGVLQRPGVYILYRDDVPYYIGKAGKLWTRLWLHSRPDARYGLFWNYFTAFVVEDETDRTELESILITALPTANSAKPRMTRERYSKDFRRHLYKIMAKDMILQPTDTDVEELAERAIEEADE